MSEFEYMYDNTVGEYVIVRKTHPSGARHELTEEDAEEILCRYDCHDDLVAACEIAYQISHNPEVEKVLKAALAEVNKPNKENSGEERGQNEVDETKI